MTTLLATRVVEYPTKLVIRRRKMEEIVQYTKALFKNEIDQSEFSFNETYGRFQFDLVKPKCCISIETNDMSGDVHLVHVNIGSLSFVFRIDCNNYDMRISYLKEMIGNSELQLFMAYLNGFLKGQGNDNEAVVHIYETEYGLVTFSVRLGKNYWFSAEYESDIFDLERITTKFTNEIF